MTVYAIFAGGSEVARLSLATSAGRAHAYVHWAGAPIVSGASDDEDFDMAMHRVAWRMKTVHAPEAPFRAFRRALLSGYRVLAGLRDAGFEVHCVNGGSR